MKKKIMIVLIILCVIVVSIFIIFSKNKSCRQENISLYNGDVKLTGNLLLPKENIEDSLPSIKCPVLAIFGNKDLYVDIDQSISVYKEILCERIKTDCIIKLYENADHSMLYTTKKHFVHSGISMYVNLLKYKLLGTKAFANGILKQLLHL